MGSAHINISPGHPVANITGFGQKPLRFRPRNSRRSVKDLCSPDAFAWQNLRMGSFHELNKKWQRINIIYYEVGFFKSI